METARGSMEGAGSDVPELIFVSVLAEDAHDARSETMNRFQFSGVSEGSRGCLDRHAPSGASDDGIWRSADLTQPDWAQRDLAVRVAGGVPEFGPGSNFGKYDHDARSETMDRFRSPAFRVDA